MKLAIVQYRCAACAHAFDTPELDPNSYGQFLLRSATNEIAFLDALNDWAYADVDQLLAQLPRVASMRLSNRPSQVTRLAEGDQDQRQPEPIQIFNHPGKHHSAATEPDSGS